MKENSKCPVTGATSHAAARGTSNSDWWPNQINLKILHQNSAKGNPMGEEDLTDWTFDSTWFPTEKALFEDYDSFNHNCSVVSGISECMVFPIPAKHIINFVMAKDSSTQVRIRLVNQQFEQLISIDSLYDDDIQFNLDVFELTSGSIVRMYYVFINKDSCMFKGHGDIKIY